RMLGSISDADDAVQETWLRLSRADTAGVQNLTGWLTTVVARVSLDMLRSRTSRREELYGESVPEPPASHDERTDPDHVSPSLASCDVVCHLRRRMAKGERHTGSA